MFIGSINKLLKKDKKLKYILHKTNKKINKLLIKYNKWECNADWNTKAIEVNPYYHNLQIMRNKYILLQESQESQELQENQYILNLSNHIIQTV